MSFFFSGALGVLVRLTTCKRLAHYLPKSLQAFNTLPLKRRDDSRSAGITGGRVNIQAVSFPGYYEESIFQVRHGWGEGQQFIVNSGGWRIRTHGPKEHGLSTTPFCQGISGVLVRLTTCKRLTDCSLPALKALEQQAPVTLAWKNTPGKNQDYVRFSVRPRYVFFYHTETILRSASMRF